MMQALLRAGPPALFLLTLTAWDGGGAAAADPPGFEVYHYASEVEGRAFREVFIVSAVDPGLAAATADVELRDNGVPLAVAWQDADGRLGVDDRFWFVQEAFDRKQVLTGHVHGQQLMECMFGGGAGLPFTPQEWAEMGQPEQVRCLRLTDDQVTT